MPCNFNLRELAERVKEGVRAAGGTPMEFNTIAISDGVTMGTEGMKASLVSREVIADSIELVGRGHMLRRARDASSAATRRSRRPRWRCAGWTCPASCSTAARSLPGRSRATTSRSRTCSRRSGANAAGKMSDEDFARRRGPRLPRRRRVRRPVHRQHDGDGARVPRHSRRRRERSVPADRPAKGDVARRAGRAGHGPAACAGDCAARHRHPRGVRERDRVGRRDSAARRTPCCTCSRSRARPAVPLDDRRLRRDLRRARRSSPTSSRAAASWPPTLRPAGGIAAGRPAAARARAARTAARAPSTGARSPRRRGSAVETPGQEVVVASTTPLSRHGGLVILKGNLAPEGAW